MLQVRDLRSSGRQTVTDRRSRFVAESGLRIISNNREFWYWGVQLDPDLLLTISSLYPEWFRVSTPAVLLGETDLASAVSYRVIHSIMDSVTP